ncbi:MAG: hypothetical protein IPM48_00980 [Saprospiraceae bacterium]|nr:hypothetical protein [Saprospiraceae bacterium]
MNHSIFHTNYFITRVFTLFITSFPFFLMADFSAFAQTSPQLILHCDWEDLAKTSFYRGDPVVLKIKQEPDYEEWAKYTGRPLVLENFENGSLVFALSNKKKLRVPQAAVDTIQLINAKTKGQSGLNIAGISLSILGLLFGIGAIFSGKKRSDSLLDEVDNVASSCLLLLLGIVFFLVGSVLFLSSLHPKVSEKNKLGREIAFDNPRCKCSWTEHP